MKSLFTIHIGEYLVGSYIESRFKNINVWLPSKDTGIDLLLTNANNTKTTSIQVKFSKDFLSSDWDEIFQIGLKSCGWWTLNKKKIENSKADFWIFVQHGFNAKELQFVIIKPKELLQLFKNLKREGNTLQTYIWVTKKDKCWESRGLNGQDQVLVANNMYKNSDRDLTSYLNNWKPMLDSLKS
jgi:hypothetical protein